MAAWGILSSIIRWPLEKLHNLESSSSSSAAESNLEQEMRELEKTMKRIQAKIVDLELEEKYKRSESENFWFSELKEVVYDAQDIVEEYGYEVLPSKLKMAKESSDDKGKLTAKENCKGKHKVFDYTITTSLDTSVLDELADKVKKIRVRFDEITMDWEAPLRSAKKVRKRKGRHLAKHPETGSLVVESDVYGREEEKKILVKFLVPEDDTNSARNGVSVLPIIGMEGVGKTTLAKLVYNDQRVQSYYDSTGWVDVAESFHVVGLTRKILESFLTDKVDYEELEELQHALQQKLKGKKFLLVLDDVWDDNFTLWEQVKTPLLSATVGKIIVTTRSESVAKVMGTPRYGLKLNVLPFDVCWSLFKRIAFDGRDPSMLDTFVEIGLKIVDKCRGLPSAVKVLGYALRNKDDEYTWMDALESEMWEFDEGKDEILPARQISCDYMNITGLRRCFPYLSLFPKDTVLRPGRIVLLWMSQGFLQPASRKGLLHPRGNKQAEEIGSDYIKGLVKRSILQPYADSDDAVFLEDDDCPIYAEAGETYIMHDVFHSLAQYVARDECLRIEDNMFDPSKHRKIRHLSVNVKESDMPVYLEAFQGLKSLRTLFIRGQGPLCRASICGSLADLLNKLKYIRALDLSYSNIKELPDSIGNLKLLRWLSLVGTDVKSLPDSICNLYNLETLNLTKTYVSKLPRQIINLTSLRHLLLYVSCVFLPSGIGELTDLQTLSNFRVSSQNGYSQLGELNHLAQLKGCLSISNLRYVNQFSYVPNSEPLKSKDQLETMRLCWGHDDKDCHFVARPVAEEDHDDHEDEEYYGNSKGGKGDEHANKEMRLLEYLRPHTNLKMLQIYDYPGVSFAKWVGTSSFSKLVQLWLCRCRKCNFLPPLGQLHSLKLLHIQEMDGVHSVGREFCSSSPMVKAFPSLESLAFVRMPNWEVWDEVEVGDFPHLQHTQLYECPKLTKFPQHLMSSVKELSIKGCAGVSSLLKFD
ncbi:putative disease resistance RPP13-like protein 1 isoform X1 [Curcuma longa]|uniref:putative disease resistance RPP13-like protein 1 isoform X1 n=1 Tax=Curcuma longa TaxID=136217 RepID=UPI003D9E49AB